MNAKHGSRKPSRKDDSSHDGTRLCLLQAAKKLFAKCGFEGCSIRTLAEEADVNISAVSYHFAGKEGLYRAVVEPIARRVSLLADQTLKTPQNVADFRARLEIFIEQFLRIHIEEPEIGEIVQRDFPGTNEVANDVFINSFLPVEKALRIYIESAQKAKLINQDFDAELTTSLLLSGMSGVFRFEPVRKIAGRPLFFDDKRAARSIAAIVSCFCDGMMIRPDNKGAK